MDGKDEMGWSSIAIDRMDVRMYVCICAPDRITLTTERTYAKDKRSGRKE